MKSILRKMVAVFCLMVAMVATVDAQSSFAYQAVIRTANGEVVSEKKVSMRFSLKYNNEVVYSETHQPTTSKYGNVEVKVGEGQKVSGDFAKVPWHTMQVMMQIEADPNGGTNYIDLGAIQLQPAPYAMHAASTGLVVDSSSPKSGSGALFEVKDKDGNPVFAVYPDGVRVYVDDADGKAIATGFAVAGRRAAKDGEEANLFSVTSEGTQVTVDDAEGKAMATGFAVAGRRAAKDADAELFTVNSTGTQVYIDTDADGKAMQTGFAVAGRRAAKDGETDKYLEINESGTQIYIDDDAEGKPIATGFAVAGRRAAKGNNKYMEVTADGTTVFVDNADGKAMATGFAVAGRRAAKGKNLKLFEVNEYGTHIYIDEDAADKAMATGFAVAGRRAAKDGSPEKYMVIDADGAIIYVDYDDAKAMQTGFAVAGRRAAKDGAPSSILTVNNHDGTHVYIDDAEGKAMQTGFAVAGRRAAKDGQYIMQITDKSALMVTQNLMIDDKESNKSMMTMTTEGTIIKTENFVVAKEVENSDGTMEETSVFQATPEQGVQIAAESKVVVKGDVAQSVKAEAITAADGAVLPGPISVFSEIVDTICSKYANILGQTNGYKLLKIHGKGLYTVNDNYDADGNAVIMFNKDGKVTYDNKSAALVVILTNPDSYKDAKMIFWPCCQINNLIVNFGLMDADGSNEYLPVQVVVNSVDSVVSRVELLSANEKMGTVELNGVPAYGSIVSAVAKPAPGFRFIYWDGYVGDEWRGYQSNPLSIGIGWDIIKLTADFELMFYNVEFIADPFEGGELEVVTKKQGISYEDYIDEQHHNMEGQGGRTEAEIYRNYTWNGNNFNAGEELSEYGYYDTYGAEFTITAKPAEGFKFKNWNNNPQLTNPVIDVFTVTGDTLLKAIFEPITGTQPFGGKAATLPGVIEAENFDVGLGAFNDVWTENSPSDYRSTTFGIECFNEKNKEYAINYTAGGEWVDYTVKVEKAQKMRWAVRYANYEYPDAQIFISRDGENITGIQNVKQTPSWSNYRTIWGETNSSLPAGEYKLRLNFKNTGNSDQNPFNCNVDKMMFAPTDYALLATDVIQPEDPGGWGAAGHVSGFGFYEVGKTANISAKAEEGYVFDGWYDAGGNRLSTKEDSSVTISGDLHLYAKFVSEEDNGPQSSIYIISNGTIEVIDGGGPINYYDWPKELSGSMTFNQYRVKQNEEVTLSVAGKGKFLGWYYYTLDDSVSIAQGSFEPKEESIVEDWYFNQNNNCYEFTLTPISLENRFVAMFEEENDNGGKGTIEIQTNGEVGLFKILDLNGNSEGIDPTDSLELVDNATDEVTGYIYTYECNVGDSIQLLANVHITETFYGWYGNYADTEFDELTDDDFSSEWLLGNVTIVDGEPEYSYEYSFKVTKTTNRFVAIFDEEEQQPTGATIQVKTNGEIQLTVGDQPLTANETQEGDGYTTYTFTCAKGDNVTFTALNDFFFKWMVV